MNEAVHQNKAILIVDDEPELLEMIQLILNEAGYETIQTAQSCQEALQKTKEFQPDLAILDVMLPDGTGFELIKKLKQTADFPVIFLTAKGEDDDRITGFELGADDYVVKPFLPKELLFRISAILKRSYREETKQIRLKNCIVDFETASVLRGKDEIALTAKEFAILDVLQRNAGKIVTIDALCEAVWGDNPFGYENSLMAHIRRIREKIEATPSKPDSLLTVKGLGYKLLLKGKAHV